MTTANELGNIAQRRRNGVAGGFERVARGPGVGVLEFPVELVWRSAKRATIAVERADAS